MTFCRGNDLSPQTPNYHFYAPDQKYCGPFDPNGNLFWKGRHHMFFIYQDENLPHGGHCWGHASSADLIHWKIHPPALVPHPGEPDLGIFSGCGLLDLNGVPTLVYYGIDAGICIATAADDELEHWVKSPHNPVLPQPKNSPLEKIYNVFDPHVWIEDGHYMAILGALMRPFMQRDTAYLFRSPDLIHWEYLRPFYTPNCHWTEEYEDMACPDFFKLGNRYVLLGISHPCGARYYLGDYQFGTFIPEEHHRLNFPGGSLFAPETSLDGKGRRIVWFWMQAQEDKHNHWQCGDQIMALPRVMTLNAAGQVEWDVPEEYLALRGPEQAAGPFEVKRRTPYFLPECHGDCLELELSMSSVPERTVLRVLQSEDEREFAEIVLDPQQQLLSIDLSHIGLRSDAIKNFPIYLGPPPRCVLCQSAPFEFCPHGEKLQLRIFIDRSVVEVFANRRQVLSQRVYPALGNNRKISFVTDAESITVDCLKSWPMKPLQFT